MYIGIALLENVRTNGTVKTRDHVKRMINKQRIEKRKFTDHKSSSKIGAFLHAVTWKCAKPHKHRSKCANPGHCNKMSRGNNTA